MPSSVVVVILALCLAAPAASAGDGAQASQQQAADPIPDGAQVRAPSSPPIPRSPSESAHDRVEILSVLDPVLEFTPFLDALQRLVDRARQSPVHMAVLRSYLTESNVVYLGRRLCYCIRDNQAATEQLVRFFIDDCRCTSLASFMIGIFIDSSVMDELPNAVLAIRPQESGRINAKLVEAVPEPLRHLLGLCGVSNVILNDHPGLVRGNAKLLSALFRIGISFPLDVRAWPDLTLDEFRAMAPYLYDTNFQLVFPELVRTGRYDLVLEMFHHRSLIRSFSVQFSHYFAPILYLYCHVAIKLEQTGILDGFLAIPPVKAAMGLLATQHPHDVLSDARSQLGRRGRARPWPIID